MSCLVKLGLTDPVSLEEGYTFENYIFKDDSFVIPKVGEGTYLYTCCSQQYY